MNWAIERDATGLPCRLLWLGPAVDAASQPEARERVLRCLEAAGSAGILGHDLCELAGTHAAIRRVWELSQYGYVIEKTYVRRNCYRYRLTRTEPWARDPNLTVREARTQEQARLRAIEAEIRPLQPLAQPTLFQVGL